MTTTEPPVLFLDVDEVLCFARVRTAMPDGDGIDPVSAAMVARVCEATGARLVISSTWRSSPDECLAMLRAHGLERHLRSPIGGPDDDWRVEAQNASRSLAIRNWLTAHPATTVWAILDDSFQDFDEGQLGRLIHTNMMFGLGLDERSRAMRLLGRGDLGPRADDGRYQTPRHTLSNLAAAAIAALDEGDDDGARRLLAVIRDHPLAA